MQTLPPDALVAQLRWRYATQKFDATRKIGDAVWSALEDALVLAPSSFGLQPWRFVVVTDAAVREQLLPVSFHQRQIVDGSHLVVFAIKKGLDAAWVERYVQRIAELRGGARESYDSYKKSMLGFISLPKEKLDIDAWSARQLYIALGQFMAAAAVIGIDTCPMEGIKPARYDEILGLAATGYATLCACVAGYRTADDKYATLPKVRFANDVVIARV